MRVIHIETLVLPVFGVLDDDGNVVEKLNASKEPLRVNALSEEVFKNLASEITRVKKEYQKLLDEKVSEREAAEAAIAEDNEEEEESKPPVKKKKIE